MQTTRTPYSVSFMATVLLLLLFACHSTIANAAVALGNTLQLAIISRIKMFYRPTHLAMAPEEAPAMLRFRRSGSKLTLINPTPYFITVTNMKAGNSNLPNTMVPPKGEVSVDIPHAVTGDISFQTINDYGALTPRIKATMQ
ncbi:periplasmic chaperone FmlB protein [Escherichia coli]|uniref:fimbrial biogenesis chaperone n=1 Tax=Escherichia coli TaxID=562 RepID=UPI0003917DF3|nr:periplasmic chaperone FmlB protein [Escherichia coli]EQZ99520.1 periplasmic chaperone FmlB protein [Escherichia coli UMEA 3705-1]